MAIQNAINRVLGTVAAGAVSIAKADEVAALKTEQGLLAKEQLHESQADVTKLTGEVKEAEKLVQEKTAISDSLADKKPGGKGNTKAAIKEKQEKALSEKEAAERAFSELKDRIEAKKAMIERANLIMTRTGVIGGKK